MKNEKNTKILIGGIANGEEALSFLDELANTKNKTFDEYILAYVDFLGMKEKMDSQSGFDALQIIKYLLFNTKHVANHISKTNKIDDFIIRVFSDNILITQKINSQAAGDQIISIVNLIWSLQFWALVQFGFTMRGGITTGQLYIDENVVWGNGLVEAYHLENDLAIYPRIVVSDKLIDLYNQNQEKTLNLFAFLKKDFDGLLFVDFLTAAPNINAIPKISECLKERVQEYKDKSDRVRQKINWIIRYFNECCLQYDERIAVKDYALEYL